MDPRLEEQEAVVAAVAAAAITIVVVVEVCKTVVDTAAVGTIVVAVALVAVALDLFYHVVHSRCSAPQLPVEQVALPVVALPVVALPVEQVALPVVALPVVALPVVALLVDDQWMVSVAVVAVVSPDATNFVDDLPLSIFSTRPNEFLLVLSPDECYHWTHCCKSKFCDCFLVSVRSFVERYHVERYHQRVV